MPFRINLSWKKMSECIGPNKSQTICHRSVRVRVAIFTHETVIQQNIHLREKCHDQVIYDTHFCRHIQLCQTCSCLFVHPQHGRERACWDMCLSACATSWSNAFWENFSFLSIWAWRWFGKEIPPKCLLVKCFPQPYTEIKHWWIMIKFFFFFEHVGQIYRV